MKDGVKNLAKKFEGGVHNASNSLYADTSSDYGLARNGLSRAELAEQAELLRRAEGEKASLLFIANLQKEEARYNESDDELLRRAEGEKASLLFIANLQKEEARHNKIDDNEIDPETAALILQLEEEERRNSYMFS